MVCGSKPDGSLDGGFANSIPIWNGLPAKEHPAPPAVRPACTAAQPEQSDASGRPPRRNRLPTVIGPDGSNSRKCGSPAFAHECRRRLSRRSALNSRSAKADLTYVARASARLRHGKVECPEQAVGSPKSGYGSAVRLNRFPSNAIPSGKNSCCSRCLLIERGLHPRSCGCGRVSRPVCCCLRLFLTAKETGSKCPPLVPAL